MTRGLFVALDGLDGTGKSTQCRLLADWLRGRGRTVITCVDPGGTPIGDRLRQLIFHPEHALSVACEALLFMASRAQLVGEVVRPALTAGTDVVSDRFLLANVVYQGHAGGLDPEEVWQVGRFSTGGLEPDLTLVLDLPPAAARVRRGRPADRNESRDAANHSRVRSGFLAEARRRPDRVRVIDASGPVEAVQQSICEEVSRLLGDG
jgi:dTMP kinase